MIAVPGGWRTRSGVVQMSRNLDGRREVGQCGCQWENGHTAVANAGYPRVSMIDQDPALQLDVLAEAGCVKVFEDRALENAASDFMASKLVTNNF